MDLGYDREETGYEEGYQKSRHQEASRHTSVSNASDSQRGGYYCQQPPEPLAGHPRRNILTLTDQRLKLRSLSDPSSGDKKTDPVPSLPGPLLVENNPTDTKVFSQKPDAKTQQIIGPTRPYQAAPPAHPSVETQSLARFRLEDELRDKKKLSREEADAYMAQFEKIPSASRDKAMKRDLEVVRLKSKEQLQKDIQDLKAKNSPKIPLLMDEGPKHNSALRPVAGKAEAKPASVPSPSQAPGLKEVNAMVNALPDPLRAKAIEHSRDQLFYTLTGTQFDPGKPVNLPKDIYVIQPPLTRREALAYMQSEKVSDAEGNPLAGTTVEKFINKAHEVQSYDLGPNMIKYEVAKWERQEIVKILSAPPYDYEKKGQQITRFMQSQQWFSDSPNLDAMEAFRKKASEKKNVEEIKSRIQSANIAGNDPQDPTEKDRADQILQNLNPKKGKANEGAQDARAGRELSRKEGAANRDMQLKIVRMQQDGENERSRLNRENQNELSAKDREFKAEDNKKQREHDAKQQAENRKNQMMMTLIQFLGSIITSAMQALAQVSAASIQGQSQLAGQIIAGIRQR